MLLHNLAKIEWIHVRCDATLERDVLCMVETENPLHTDIQTETSLEIYDKNCIMVNNTGYKTSWNSKFNDRQNIGIKSFQFIFYVISGNYPSIFSDTYKHRLKYNSNYYLYKFPSDVSEGFYILSENPKNFTKQGNLIQCASGSFISIICLCDGISDCPDDNPVDEIEFQRNITKQSKFETTQNIRIYFLKFHALNTQLKDEKK